MQTNFAEMVGTADAVLAGHFLDTDTSHALNQECRELTPELGLSPDTTKEASAGPVSRRLGLRDARCISWCHDRRVELHERNGWTHVPWFPDLHGRICIRRTNDHRSGNVPYRSHSRGLTGIHDAMELHCRERLTDLKSRGVTDDLSRRPGCEPHPGRWLVTPDPGTQPLITDPCGLRPW